MNIALIAHDKKKELIVDFCIAYKQILQNHNLFATGATGALITEATGLHVHMYSPGTLGGVQQISARIALNEIDLVIFLRDSVTSREYESEIISFLSLCDAYNIPFATNIATAEVLIKGVERGDLSWRELVNPCYKQ